MEALNSKRLRLRHELQEAYDAWMDATVWQARDPSHRPLGAAARPSLKAMPQWFDYLAAKQRLVLAYADVSDAA